MAEMRDGASDRPRGHRAEAALLRRLDAFNDLDFDGLDPRSGPAALFHLERAAML